jgi:hypothetical protein
MDWRMPKLAVHAGLAIALTMAMGGCGMDADDQAVIDQLRAAGADLTQAREVRYYLYVPTQSDASSLAAAVQSGGRLVQVEAAATGSDWLVLITETVVVDAATMASRREEFARAVEPFGGVYDGWEAAAVP